MKEMLWPELQKRTKTRQLQKAQVRIPTLDISPLLPKLLGIQMRATFCKVGKRHIEERNAAFCHSGLLSAAGVSDWFQDLSQILRLLEGERHRRRSWRMSWLISKSNVGEKGQNGRRRPMTIGG